MAKLKGSIVLLVSALLLVYEVYFLLIEPLQFSDDVAITSNQYWALVIPVLIGISILTGTSAWVGYTMITTPEPILMNYEEAYEIAESEERT